MRLAAHHAPDGVWVWLDSAMGKTNTRWFSPTSASRGESDWFIRQSAAASIVPSGTSDKIGTIQRRLAWPLRKDDTHKSINGPIFFQISMKVHGAFFLALLCVLLFLLKGPLVSFCYQRGPQYCLFEFRSTRFLIVVIADITFLWQLFSLFKLLLDVSGLVFCFSPSTGSAFLQFIIVFVP